MEKSAKKELITYSLILVILIIVIVIKNFALSKTDNTNTVENVTNQTNEQYLTVDNTTYNTIYQEEWMGEV